MAWYATGTVTINNGSTAVTGAGTTFIANVEIGEAFVAPDGRVYEITAIGSNTSLTIAPAYLGSNVSGAAYRILPARGRIADLIAETSSLLSSFATVRDGIGAGLMQDGSASAPGLRFAADQDTGFRRTGNNSIGIVAGGADRVRVGDSLTDVLTRASITSGGFFPLTVNQTSTTQFESSGVLMLGPSSLGNQGGTGISTINLNAGATQGGMQIAQYSAAGAFQRGLCAYSYQTHEWDFFTNGNLRLRILSDGHIRPGADNAQTLGTGSFRWSTVFAATGTINTSDAREKQWRGPLNAAELRAAKRIIGELGIYQWLDAVAEKGEDEARLHFGVRAQQAFAIMEDEGLDWRRYAWCCFDEWEATDGAPAGDRYGIRTDQLAFWLIAAQADIQADIEARLAALEAAA